MFEEETLSTSDFLNPIEFGDNLHTGLTQLQFNHSKYAYDHSASGAYTRPYRICFNFIIYISAIELFEV